MMIFVTMKTKLPKKINFHLLEEVAKRVIDYLFEDTIQNCIDLKMKLENLTHKFKYKGTRSLIFPIR